MRTLVLAFALLLFAPVTRALDTVVLRNQEGQEITCSINGITGEDVMLRRVDGMSFRYPLASLDEKSQALVRSALMASQPPRMEVRSVMTSSREDKSCDIYGYEHRLGYKTRAFEIEVRSFLPFDTPVVVECYFFDGKKLGKEVYRGKVSQERDWKFTVDESTKWHAVDYNPAALGRATDVMTGSRKIDLVVLLRSANGTVAEEYYTSRSALDVVNDYLNR